MRISTLLVAASMTMGAATCVIIATHALAERRYIDAAYWALALALCLSVTTYLIDHHDEE